MSPDKEDKKDSDKQKEKPQEEKPRNEKPLNLPKPSESTITNASKDEEKEKGEITLDE